MLLGRPCGTDVTLREHLHYLGTTDQQVSLAIEPTQQAQE